MVDVKICGISSLGDYEVCSAAGAKWVGLVHYPGSPRHLDIKALANLTRQIEHITNNDIKRVLLSVDQSLVSLRSLISAARPDYLQLHGEESIAFAKAIKAEFGLPIIKMIPVATAKDVANCEAWDSVADWLIFDAKSDHGIQPGGTGHSFDWRVLSHYGGRIPWMLAGGLTPSSVASAIKISGAKAVDVSSGVESAAGKKDENKIHDFIRAAQMG